MTKTEIIALIDQELKNIGEHSPSDCTKLQNSRVDPEEINHTNEVDETVDLWVILEEDIKTKTGYKVVYDESSGQFGVAMNSILNERIFLGYEKGLLEAYNSIFEDKSNPR